MSDVKGWIITETVGMGMPNPRQVVSLPITDEMWSEIEAEAAAVGMTPRAYLDRVVAEYNAEIEDAPQD